MRGVFSGTEYYKALNNIDGMSVHSLLVWDESGTQYKALDDRDTNLSREEKSGTCGILKKSDGYELCWGIDTKRNLLALNQLSFVSPCLNSVTPKLAVTVVPIYICVLNSFDSFS